MTEGRGPTLTELTYLMTLSGKPSGSVYQGTASPYKVAARRAKNKVARASRKTNRGSRG